MRRLERRVSAQSFGVDTAPRGATGKVAVFGILKRGGKVYTKIVNDTKAITLMPLIARKIAPDSVGLAPPLVQQK